MIIGVGIDLAEIERFRSLLARWGSRFTRRLFTEHERDYAEQRAVPEQHYAARFAAKEAMLKALGVPKGLSWHELEIYRDSKQPIFRLNGKAEKCFLEKGGSKIHLSLTHSKSVASAVVVLENLKL